jgi:hypothetical protein
MFNSFVFRHLGAIGKGKIIKPVVAIGVWSVFTIVAIAEDSSPLAQLIEKTVSEASSDRVLGYKSLANYWGRQQNALSDFSDIPIDSVAPKAEKLISDADLDKIARAVEQGIDDPESEVRKNAAIALARVPRSSGAVESAVLAGIKSGDPTVNWYVTQQRTNVWPNIDLVIERLVENLSSQEFNQHDLASKLLRIYGERARPYSKRIVDTVLKDGSYPYRYSKLYVLYDIGLTEEAAKALVNHADELSADESAIAALALLEYPDALKLLQAKHPSLIQSLEKHTARLFPFLCKHQHEPHKTRNWLASSQSLPANIMGMLGDRLFIEEITKLEASSSNHDKTFLSACKRACGQKADFIVVIDSKRPVEFRPASAWPNVDDRRLGKTSTGHADGGTHVMVTGEIRAGDGSHPKNVSFYRTNDAILLGTKQDHREPLMYDPKTGRFVYLTTVFAAYGMGGDQPEPGPYQTGSAQIRVEAPKFKPLVVQFFDEMPDVRIILDNED